MRETLIHNVPFVLESGAVLPGLEIAYHTYGTLNADRSNAIWVCHALTANSDVADWWPHTVEKGRFLDPEKYFIVCANILGSCYGTTGPTSVNPATGEPWYGDFPLVSVADMVHAHQLLARHLGIRQVQLLIGASIGGFQALEWAQQEPDFARRYAFIATGAEASPWVAALNESQRMAIEVDETWGQRTPEAGSGGMAVARSLALLSYRGGSGYNRAQAEHEERKDWFTHRSHSYQRYQGEKLRRRFNAYSYYRMTQAVDSHHAAPVAAPTKARVLVVAISSDILFPPAEHQAILDRYPQAAYHVIESPFGHDGFLVEAEQLNTIITHFLHE